jgi:hypothetical protein
MKIIEVTWLDHREDGQAWQSYHDAVNLQPAECHTVGYLVHEDDDRIVVTSTWLNDDDETVGGAFVILASAVTHLRVLSDPNPARHQTTLLAELAERWKQL